MEPETVFLTGSQLLWLSLVCEVAKSSKVRPGQLFSHLVGGSYHRGMIVVSVSFRKSALKAVKKLPESGRMQAKWESCC